MAPDKPGFFAELKRRHVWRAAVAYAVAGWLLVQVATQVFPFFDIPNWSVRLVVILIVIGFPVAVALAWAFEITPEGIRRTEPAQSPDARTEHDASAVARKLNVAIIAVLILAVGVMGWRLLAQRRAPESPATGRGIIATAQAPAVSATAAPAAQAAAATTPATSAIPAKSIAVLPFDNLSGDKDNAYFVAGMQDLILTKLADIGDLKVISRTSTAKYASHPDDLKTIGLQLGVATILEGSVQKQGSQVLVNVQLVDTTNDSHLWAQSYTRTLDNVFGVEAEVAGQIATALHARLSPAESENVAAVPTKNEAAYDLFLRAEYMASKGENDQGYDTPSWKAAIALYRQAVQRDQGFALAFARLSYIEGELAWHGGAGEDTTQLYRRQREDAERAVQLEPQLAAAHLAMGYAEYYDRHDYATALQAFAEALRLKPNYADALVARGFVERRQGHFDAAIASMDSALAVDPRNVQLLGEQCLTYMAVARYADAGRACRRTLALDPDNRMAKLQYSDTILFDTGDFSRAMTMAEGDAPALKVQRALLFVLQRRYHDAVALLDSVPDTSDNFLVGANGTGLKLSLLARAYRLMGDAARAKSAYAQALPALRTQLAMQQGMSRGYVWQNIADAQIGLGQVAAGLESIAKSLKVIDEVGDHLKGPDLMLIDAQAYAHARRPDLAVPLLAKAMTRTAIGGCYSPAMLWLDPAWDPIRKDARFQALLKHYAKYKPAVTYEAAADAGGSHE